MRSRASSTRAAQGPPPLCFERHPKQLGDARTIMPRAKTASIRFLCSDHLGGKPASSRPPQALHRAEKIHGLIRSPISLEVLGAGNECLNVSLASTLGEIQKEGTSWGAGSRGSWMRAPASLRLQPRPCTLSGCNLLPGYVDEWSSSEAVEMCDMHAARSVAEAKGLDKQLATTGMDSSSDISRILIRSYWRIGHQTLHGAKTHPVVHTVDQINLPASGLRRTILTTSDASGACDQQYDVRTSPFTAP
ncbi:hypothetical protein BV20DRAFT_1081912 [Pilatotrama ljubarskyi]|nr:hypothetical protein BV20DRAFT_1081912 [Pilatotrama ljubarskyi]